VKKIEVGKVTAFEQIRKDIFRAVVSCPSICKISYPGQFLHIKVNDSFTPILRRPISIGRIKDDQLELIWRVVGEGTRILAELSVGDNIDLLGPLGKPYTISKDTKHAILVAGGLGLPPLLYLYEKMNMMGISTKLLLGVRDRDSIPINEEDSIFDNIEIIAENDSGFRKGLVTEPVIELLDEYKDDIDKTALYSCGPLGLVGALQRVVPKGKLQIAEVSLETQMACGIGVCQGCATEVKGGSTPYQLVCNDGPVFDLFDVEVHNG
jgi:dihydroorotate dehydrogenase electron transfer subunit